MLESKWRERKEDYIENKTKKLPAKKKDFKSEKSI